MSDTSFQFDNRLDQAFLDSIYEGDLEHAQMVFDDFVNRVPSQMADIDREFQHRNQTEFRQKVHKLKPVFSYVGLTSLMQQAEEMEKQCLQIHTLDEINHLYSAFKSAYQQALPIIEQELNRLNEAA
ncbi:MAG TPA: Hpt domain-containing protein [Ferruginibacter sp.]|nr:Hpt domain-containing protein [Ferruginibacter sp.]